MKYKLVKLNQISGYEASIYTVFLNEVGKTVFDLFIEENKNLFKSEIEDIVSRLKVIGNKTGARIEYFKDNEGNPGDGVCALYDKPNSNLRLYCIRYGASIVIIGGGGPKPKSVRSLQQDEKLSEENYFLRELSKAIKTKVVNGEIKFSSDYMDFEGDLTFNDQSDE